MAKITKVGELPGKHILSARCNSCKTEFEFAAQEAEYKSDQREGDYYEIACPLPGCGKTVLKSVR